MPRFQYVALDSRGQESSGVLEANTQAEAIAALRQAGYFPKSITEETKSSRKAQKTGGVSATGASAKGLSFNPFQRSTVKGKTLMIFTRQLATLLDAGLPLLRGLTVLAKQEPDPVLRRVIVNLAESVQGGSTFSESLAAHPKIFNKLYVNMVKAGELGGVLELVLTRLAEFHEKAQKTKNKVISAMFYPAIVLLIAVVIMGFLLVFIVPKFEAIFADMLGGRPLPALTVMVINASNLVKDNLVLIVAGIAVLVILFKLIQKTKKGEELIDNIKLHAPLIGDLNRKSAISRFTRTLGTLVTSGVPILQALTITRETAGNVIIANAINKVHDAVKEGESVVAPLETSGVFPPMVISMVDVGEQTGQLPQMLLKIAEVYDDEVDNAVAGLTSLLEPIMIVFLALVVGTIVIALFLPLISIITQMQA
ncbi:MAG: type II secretion system F family protein [Chthoniobacterales bacterium]|nr:type II secretion system F family protein [Chthoniobacterales bacterium]